MSSVTRLRQTASYLINRSADEEKGDLCVWVTRVEMESMSIASKQAKETSATVRAIVCRGHSSI